MHNVIINCKYMFNESVVAAAAPPPSPPQQRPPNLRAVKQQLFDLLNSSSNSFRRLSQIHGRLVLHGFSLKSPTLHSKLLSSLLNITTSFPDHSFSLYNHMRRNSLHQAHLITYSYFLTFCARHGLQGQARQLHARVVSDGFFSNPYVQTNLLNIYANATGDEGVHGSVGRARRLFDEMQCRTIVAWNSMLSGYMRFNEIDNARVLFDEMPERNVVSWTTMVTGFDRAGESRLALSYFRRMLSNHIEPDQVAMVAALSACAELGDLTLGNWIHAYVDRHKTYDRSKQESYRLISLDNALIHMYAKCGVVDRAYEIFVKMKQRSAVSWTTMITGFAMHGHGEDALRVFKEMEDDGRIAPDGITFLGLLCACCHMGWVDEGRRLFHRMSRVYRLEPAIEHYGCLVDLLSRAGLLVEAMAVIETMPFNPNDVVWGAVLAGCKIHKNVDLATVAAEKLCLRDLNPEKAAGYLVLLSNLYANAGEWDEVVKMRKIMIEMRVKKPFGRSLIQLKGLVHEFVSSGHSHPSSDKIYELVHELTAHTKFGGYVPDILLEGDEI